MMDGQEGTACTFDKEFHDIVSDKKNFSHVTEKFLNNLIDDITLGIIFSLHRKFKTNGFDIEDFAALDIEKVRKESFGQRKIRKTREPCVCSNCGRAWGALKIATHLAQCMGIRKPRSNSSRRASATNNKESENPQPLNNNSTDDEDDDLDYSPGMKKEKKKKKKKKKKGNKLKKTKCLADYC